MIYKKLAACALLMLACAPALSQDFSAYKAAGKYFLERMGMPRDERVVPRLTESDAASMLATLSDSANLLDGYRFKKTSLKELMEVCSTADEIVRSYTMLHLKKDIDLVSLAPALQQKFTSMVLGNITSFEPELALLQPFMIRCLAKQAEPLVELMNELPAGSGADVRSTELRGVRDGIAGAYRVLLYFASVEALGRPYRASLLTTLADVSGVYQSIMPLSVRKEVIDDLRAMSPATRETSSGHFRQIEAAMSNTACEGLCALH